MNQLAYVESGEGSTPILRETIYELELKESHILQQLRCIRSCTQHTTDDDV